MIEFLLQLKDALLDLLTAGKWSQISGDENSGATAKE
jgi:hypothetical protein